MITDSKGWRVWYTESRVFDSTELDWVELPENGCLGAVVFYEKPYRDLVYGGDWYYLTDGYTPTCTDTHNEWGKWVGRPDVPSEYIKQSATRIPINKWNEIEDSMMEDKKWPV